MRIFFSVGEPSGDLHGANLIRELRARGDVDTYGLGGPRMKAAGCELLRDMSDLAVVGLFPVLAKLPEFFHLRRRVALALDRQKPDAVVLIDYPGFNWHVARLAKERSVPVFYYGLPQLWAWASWRVKKVERYVDHALCKLPFEERWFCDRGCHATYVGHPYFDELRNRRLDASFITERREQGRLVTLLPGSRMQEVRSNLPDLLRAAAKIRRHVGKVRFAIGSYNIVQAAEARRLAGGLDLPIETFVGRTPELISAAECCLACSGSVSLELLHHAKPAVIVYRVSRLTELVVRRLLNVRYVTLVNLLASDEPLVSNKGHRLAQAAGGEAPLYPEYPSSRDCSPEVAEHAIGWLRDEASRQTLITRLSALRDRVAASGASATAADYIVRNLLAEQRRAAA
jgi:lipid-A-disaccharide synthase